MAHVNRFGLTVVDGLAIERAALRALLSASFPTVRVEAADLAEALDAPPVDPGEAIALVDLDSIPAAEIAERFAALGELYHALVVVSATVPLDAVRAILRQGLGAFVWKGDEPSDLIAAVVSVASGRTWISEAARGRFLVDAEYRRPVLSPQESRVMHSYGGGTAVKVVADEMGIAEHTVRTYVKRIKAKYLDVGVPLESRVDFFRHLHDHDVALRNGRDGMRAVSQELLGDETGRAAV